MKKFFNIIIAVVFVVFAIVQWNDPDPWLWMFLYVYVAVSIMLFEFTDKSSYWLLAGIIFCVLLSVYYVPDIVLWIKDGMPSIATSMKAESKYIELVREFFGTILALVTFSFYYFIERRQSKRFH